MVVPRVASRDSKECDLVAPVLIVLVGSADRGIWALFGYEDEAGRDRETPSGRSRTAFTTLKIAVLAPMPRASVRMAIRLKVGLLARRRKA